MALFRYFADLDGTTVQLSNVYHDGHISTRAAHFIGTAPDGSKMNATRKIERKSNPSKPQVRCALPGTTGFKCECSCGGKNHGAGNFMCEAA